MKRVFISRKFKFEAAHHLPKHEGLCKRQHGHSYHGEITISGEVNEETGMVMDYHTLQDIIVDVLGDYDHANLNDYFENPTAEVMVQKLFIEFKKAIVLMDLVDSIKLERVSLQETENSNAWVQAE